MKILYLFQHFVPPNKPGITRVYEYATRLIKNGHEVHIITSPENLPEYQNLKTPLEVTIANIPCTVIPIAYSHHMGYTERIISYFGFAFYSTLVAIKHDADVIVAVSTPLTIAIPAIIAHLWKRKPMVLELSDLWPAVPFEMGIIKNPILKFGASVLEWLAYHNSAHIVALSEGIAEGVLARGYDASKVSVITNASDTHLFDVPPATGKPIRDRLSLKDHDKLVVYAGTFGEVNGAEYLVDIAKEMYAIDDRIKFLMVGDGKRKGIALERAKSYGILGKTIFIEDPISKNDVPAILSAATITILLVGRYNAIWKNHSANKVFDSFAAGKPIAINENRVGWLIPLFAETGVGVGLSPVDAHLAAHELYDFLNDEEKLKRATESARNLAYHRFNREILAQRFEEILISVVHENKKGKKMSEEKRMIEYYPERDSQQSAYQGFLGYRSLADLLMHQERVRNTLQLLQKYNITSHSIGGMKILDVGCGSGGILCEYLQWGATPENLAGIDLSADRVHLAKRLAPHLDIRCASATHIPYEDQTFDLVMQHVVFTSILEDDMLFTIAQQMVRVLKPNGIILWYDFFYDNPYNPGVRAVRKDKIKQLFPDLKLDLSSITLAPPIARNIPKPVLPVVYPILSSFPFLCTHYLGVLHF